MTAAPPRRSGDVLALARVYNEPMPGSDDVNPPSPKASARQAQLSPSDATDPGLKLTYDDFLLFPDDGKRHELIDGEHYVTPSPNLRHQEISGGSTC